VSDFKRNQLSDILQQPTLARTTYIGAHNVLATNFLFSQQKQKEFQLKFLPDEYPKCLNVYIKMFVLSPHSAFENASCQSLT
jgi:hypothetical protein